MTRKIINPSTAEIIAEVAIESKEQSEQIISLARATCDAGVWAEIPLAKRKELLLKISQGILDKAEDLARLESLNTGKPIKESTFMDIPSAAKTFEYFANNLERYLADEKLNLPEAESRLSREPQGLVALIVPWNYPLLIASWKMAQALAAGNCVILKPSSLTPLTAMELVKIADESGLPKGTVNIICASGQEIGQLLCSDKRLDMVSFTGSNDVGRKIIEYSSGSAKKLIMELGGKSAGIILKDADFESAVNGSLCSIFLNQGQMCTAMSRIFIEDDIYDKFIAAFVEKAKRIKLGKGLDYETQMGPLISLKQREKVDAFVERAKKEGAKILCGGKVPSDPALKNGFFFEPTVFEAALPRMQVFKEEIFGPVVCLNKFSSLEEAVKLANTCDYGLAGMIWSTDIALAQGLAKRINAGTVWINTYGMFYNEVPYGGFKQSGFGKELGREGFLEYTRLKNTVIDQTKGAKPLVNYWYGF